MGEGEIGGLASVTLRRRRSPGARWVASRARRDGACVCAGRGDFVRAQVAARGRHDRAQSALVHGRSSGFGGGIGRTSCSAASSSSTAAAAAQAAPGLPTAAAAERISPKRRRQRRRGRRRRR